MFSVLTICMCFDKKNSYLSTGDRYCRQIQHRSLPYQSLYGDKITKRLNNPLQTAAINLHF